VGWGSWTINVAILAWIGWDGPIGPPMALACCWLSGGGRSGIGVLMADSSLVEMQGLGPTGGCPVASDCQSGAGWAQSLLIINCTSCYKCYCLGTLDPLDLSMEISE
jgi:hypothetical protein